jgi:hypothetical protein
MRPLVLRLWLAHRARVARTGGRRDPVRQRGWLQGSRLSARLEAGGRGSLMAG